MSGSSCVISAPVSTRTAVLPKALSDGPPLKVLMVSHNDALFGAERSLLCLAASLSVREDFRVWVLVPRDGALAASCREAGINVIVGQYDQWVASRWSFAGVAKRTARSLLAVRRMAPLIRRLQPDVVYTNTGVVPVGAMLARRLGRPHVWHLREFVGADYGFHYDWGQRLTLKLMRERADRVVCNSQAVKRHFAPVFDGVPMDVIYNGFDFDDKPVTEARDKYRRCVQAAEPVEVLICGALVPGKGQEDAVRAVAMLGREGRSLRLTVAGTGDDAYTQHIKRLSRELGMAERIVFPGFVQDLQPYYERAALTLICSRSEAFGRTAVEAAARGTPVIATAAGGLPEVIGEEGDAGGHLLYQPGDVAGLASRMACLLDDGEFYQRQSRDGARRVRQRFASERYVSEVANVFRLTCGLQGEHTLPTN